MGRGRQKAKQTKVARELKYHSSDIDVTALQRELGNAPIPQPSALDDDEDDQYSRYANYFDEDEDEPAGSSRVRR